MKWETVKEKVGRGVYSQIIQFRDAEAMNSMLLDLTFGPRPAGAVVHHRVAKIYADKAWEVIQTWDVRSVGKLRELFPGHFPHTLRKGQLRAEYGESGEWEVTVV